MSRHSSCSSLGHHHYVGTWQGLTTSPRALAAVPARLHKSSAPSFARPRTHLQPRTLQQFTGLRASPTTTVQPEISTSGRVDPSVQDQTGSSDKPNPDVQYVSFVNGVHTVQGRLLLDAPAEHIYGILADYERSHAIFSNVDNSKVSWSEGIQQTVQDCRWSFLAFSGTFEVALKVEEDPAERTVTFSLIRSSFMRDFKGRWAVTATGSNTCEVVHQLSVVPAVPVPAPIAYYMRSIFIRQVEQILKDLQLEIRRQQSSDGMEVAKTI